MSFYLLIPGLFLLGMVTGFIGTNTGGSALVTVPLMLLLGVPPASAIGSARVASVGTMLAGLRQFHKKGKVDYKTAWPAAILGILGALVGAWWMVSLSVVTLERAIGVLTLILLILAVLSKKKRNDQIQNPPSNIKKMLGYLLFFLSGLLGGFFGGQAILSTYIFIIFFHKSMSESIGTRKVSGLAISLAAIFIYGWHGSIDWLFAISLFAGTVIGSSLGSAYGLKKGDQWLNRVFTVVVVLLSLKLIIAF